MCCHPTNDLPPMRRRYLIRASWHLAFLALYTQVLTHLATANQLEVMAAHGVFVPPITGWEQTFVVWALSLAYEHRRRRARLAEAPRLGGSRVLTPVRQRSGAEMRVLLRGSA